MNARPPQTVREIEAMVDEKELSRIQILGQTRDASSKAIAQKALDMITEVKGIARNAVYGFYAKHTATSSETIRKDVKMLELIPAEYWQRYEVIGISFFRHVTHFEIERMTQALEYALHEQPTFDEFTLLFPRVEDEEEKQALEVVSKHEYPFDLLPIIRKVRGLNRFEAAKPHLDALKKIIEME